MLHQFRLKSKNFRTIQQFQSKNIYIGVFAFAFLYYLWSLHFSGSLRANHYFECTLTRSADGFSKKVQWQQINTDWQQGWDFQGVPELDHAKKDFTVSCTRNVRFKAGKYTFFAYQRGFETIIDVGGTSFESSEANNFIVSKTLDFAQDAVYSITYAALKTNGDLGDLMFTWNHIDGTSDIDEAKTLFFNTWPQRAACKNTVDIYGSSWNYCRDSIQFPKDRCLVYSIGISNIYNFDKYMGKQGCEVFSFDCTVSYDNDLAENVRFFPYCLAAEDYTSPAGKRFRSLGSIQKELGHEGRKIDIFKIDCEGCEYEVFPQMSNEQLDLIDNLLVEFHMEADKLPQIAETTRRLKERFVPYHFAVNRGATPYIDAPQSIISQGFLNHMCCVEYGFIRKEK